MNNLKSLVRIQDQIKKKRAKRVKGVVLALLILVGASFVYYRLSFTVYIFISIVTYILINWLIDLRYNHYIDVHFDKLSYFNNGKHYEYDFEQVAFIDQNIVEYKGEPTYLTLTLLNDEIKELVAIPASGFLYSELVELCEFIQAHNSRACEEDQMKQERYLQSALAINEASSGHY